MEGYDNYVNEAVSRLKDVYGVSKVVLFGSVANGKARKGSDIDLAVILDDLMKGMCSEGLSGFPSVVEKGVSKVKRELYRRGFPDLDVSLYYESIYNKGIELYGDKDDGCDLLSDVGVVMYEDFWKDF